MGDRCFRCGRPLSAELSVRAGIGPVCRTRRQVELSREEAQRRLNLQCIHGFVCGNPSHGAVTINRFWGRFQTIAKSVGLPRLMTIQVKGDVDLYVDLLGFNRPRVETPKVEPVPFGPEVIRELNIPGEPAPGGGTQWAMPVDAEAQRRHLAARAADVCPFGLDCHTPEEAVAAVWRLLSIMRYRMEPLLLTEEGAGWSWDTLLYQHLANCLEVLGLHEDGYDIQEIARKQHAKPRRLRLLPEAV